MPFKHTKLSFKDGIRYTPRDLHDISERDLRKEYTRLRDIAQKRLKRLEKKYPDNYVLDYHPQGFKKLEDMKSLSDLKLALADVSKFVNLPSTTIRGQDRIQQERYERLVDKGFLTGFESKEEVKSLMKFVHWVAKTIKENVMYRDKWGEKIRDDKFKDEIRKGNYGKAYKMVKPTEPPKVEAISFDERTKSASYMDVENNLDDYYGGDFFD